MAMYYEITALFGRAPAPADLVERGYAALADADFPFEEGFLEAQGDSLKEITAFNQRLLDERFTLAPDQHRSEGKKQVLLASERFSEVRAFWSYFEEHEEVSLSVLAPQPEAMQGYTAAYDIASIERLHEAARALWETGLPQAVQTSCETDGIVFLSEIEAGRAPLFRPYAYFEAPFLPAAEAAYGPVEIIALGDEAYFMSEPNFTSLTAR